MHRLGFTGRLAVWSARQRVNVVLAWLGSAVLLLLLAGLVGGDYRTDYEFTDAHESQQARDLVRTLRGGDPLNEIVLVRSPSRRASDADFQQRVDQRLRAEVTRRGQPEILAEVFPQFSFCGVFPS